MQVQPGGSHSSRSLSSPLFPLFFYGTPTCAAMEYHVRSPLTPPAPTLSAAIASHCCIRTCHSSTGPRRCFLPPSLEPLPAHLRLSDRVCLPGITSKAIDHVLGYFEQFRPFLCRRSRRWILALKIPRTRAVRSPVSAPVAAFHPCWDPRLSPIARPGDGRVVERVG